MYFIFYWTISQGCFHFLESLFLASPPTPSALRCGIRSNASQSLGMAMRTSPEGEGEDNSIYLYRRKSSDVLSCPFSFRYASLC